MLDKTERSDPAQMQPERAIAEDQRRSGRQCGACSLCCRVLDVPEVGKPKGGWCRHCRPGRGCTIHDTRPQVCRDYDCLWLSWRGLGDEWFPAKSKIVVDIHPDKLSGNVFLRFNVDPRYPGRWREEPYYSRIKQLALVALRGELITDRSSTRTGKVVQTIVTVDDKWTIVLPHRELPYQPGVMLRMGENEFEYRPT